MRKFGRCETCGEYDFLETHRCPPCWYVWEPDEGETMDDGARRIYARDAEQAAERWAAREDWDSAEGAIAMGRSEPEICVATLGLEGKGVERFKLTGEMVPEYRAEPLKGKARGEEEEESEQQEEAQTA